MSKGTKFDNDKTRVDLVDSEFITSIAKVLTHGAKKYAPNNWRKGIEYSRVYGALQRHLLQWQSGIENDEESGLPHLWHAGCCLMFLIYYTNHSDDCYEELDDRYKELESSVSDIFNIKDNIDGQI